ncbi:4-coumarate--CoA ligase [Steroidobacter agaridevorans]|uniref:4-coumarate--CoA ligase n=1 Tax=Steroidobacter agaridevorans TaxID=2695856 RepID=A0A829YGR7_9GAMM|nr:class I adenylate-forming enzyme family protein [Steroidobacter agaridevorans]GFE82439.1 4-coumarate--CoA ligase [Steroidobacter agaridevorans]
MATILEFKKAHGSATAPEFRSIPEIVHEHATARPGSTAIVCNDEAIDYAALGATMDRVAASLQRADVAKGSVVAICGPSSIAYATAFLGALQAGATVAPLPSHVSKEQLLAMLGDCAATHLFLGSDLNRALSAMPTDIKRIPLDTSLANSAFNAWLTSAASKAQHVNVGANDAFNIVYSSGASSLSQGIIQSHGMRWAQSKAGAEFGFNESAVTLCAMPIESNTTLVSFFAALVGGGKIVLMPQFDARRYLELAQNHGATHTMLPPAHYQRIMEMPDFAAYDLSAFRQKFTISGPFSAAFKKQIVERWPGRLVEYYGTTEGGGVCMLDAHNFPHKLHTVGKPAPGSDIRVVDKFGEEVAPGNVGEVVGRSAAMMTGYLNRSIQPSEVWWHDKVGRPFIRTGDIGQLDQDGFLTLIDRRRGAIVAGAAARDTAETTEKPATGSRRAKVHRRRKKQLWYQY